MTRAIRPIPGITIAIALSLLVAGCAGIPNPIVTPVPHDALHPNATVAIGPTQAPDPVKLDEVGRQRAIWERLGIRTYRLGLLFGCHCDLGGRSVEARSWMGRSTSSRWTETSSTTMSGSTTR